jgi:LmbE family N-acetylglucosaminyl deacetylase
MHRVLVVAAHPDDEILGCGGSLIKHVSCGDEVYLLVLGEGITARHRNNFGVDRKDFVALNNSLDRVAQFINAKNYWHLGYPDNRFDSIDLLDIIKAVEGVVQEVSPDIVYTHFRNDLNIDHRITFQSVLTACRPSNKSSVKDLYSFYTPSATDWGEFGKDMFVPSVFVDITAHIEDKIKALSMYKEMCDFPHPRSLSSVKVSAMHYGTRVGCEYAEPYEVIYSIR